MKKRIVTDTYYVLIQVEPIRMGKVRSDEISKLFDKIETHLINHKMSLREINDFITKITDDSRRSNDQWVTRICDRELGDLNANSEATFGVWTYI